MSVSKLQFNSNIIPWKFRPSLFPVAMVPYFGIELDSEQEVLLLQSVPAALPAASGELQPVSSERMVHHCHSWQLLSLYIDQGYSMSYNVLASQNSMLI